MIGSIREQLDSLPEARIDERHIYRQREGMEGTTYRQRVYGNLLIPVVVLTEVPENHGMSVTNCVEHLAADVLARMPGADPVWIEHYPPRGSLPESFDRVDVQRGEAPRWTHLDRDGAMALIALAEAGWRRTA